MSLPDAYQDHVLNAGDVCNNCLRVVREERPRSPKWDRRKYYSPLTRRQQTTTAEYPGPPIGIRSETHSHATFCACGVETVYEREWPVYIGRDRFKRLIQALIRICRWKSITANPYTVADTALRRADAQGLNYPSTTTERYVPPDLAADPVDLALGHALEAAIARASSGGSAQNRLTSCR